MTLRVRLALALAALATVAVLAVGVTTYVNTAAALRAEVDQTLSAYSRRVSDPDARFAVALCGLVATREAEPGEAFGGGIPELPGSRVQCLTSTGQRIVTATSGRLPASAADRAVARRGGTPRFSTVDTDEGAYRVLTVGVRGGGAVMLGRSLDESDRTLSAVRTRSIVTGLGVILGAAALGWLFALRMTGPIERLTDASERIAATGELAADLPPAGRDEVGRLAGAFATMLGALTRSREQQQRLAQDAGHELRTPLTSLRANIDTLARHPDLDPEVRARVVADLGSEARELSSLTEELLDLVVEGREAEPEQSIDLPALLARTVARVERRHDHPITLEAEPCTIHGRPTLLGRAVGNLLENAAKFSPAGAPIEVRAVGGTITVRDHGPGIDPADLPHVFERFYRADAARSLPGSGLGLSIVAQIATEHGGSVEARNADGGGAILTLSIPTVTDDRFDPSDGPAPDTT